jgi:hypothetical protein
MAVERFSFVQVAGTEEARGVAEAEGDGEGVASALDCTRTGKAPMEDVRMRGAVVFVQQL